MRLLQFKCGQIIGKVDIPTERHRKDDAEPVSEPNRLANVASERAGSVGELEAAAGSDRQHVRASSVSVGGDRDARPIRESCEAS